MFERHVARYLWGSVAFLATSWITAGAALIVQRQAEAQQRRVDQASVCESSQAFSGTDCRAVIDGTVTALSTKQAEIDAGGWHLTMVVSPDQTAGFAPGTPVRVTVYRGAPIRLDGDHVHFDAVDSPADRRNNARTAVRAVMSLGTLLGAGNLVVALAVRWLHRRRPPAG
ncbi:hypothetical protein ACQP1P_17470 [Dactylosporangium sp. CA-052675]|uniref:hypothetical protein n=1 Tax=Dactylosporangium sp. CA-052675 TaxID=3239927 RepID=UPI003D942105